MRCFKICHYGRLATFTYFLLFMGRAQAVDFHAFEFNEPFQAFLSETSDSGTPGGATWVEDIDFTQSETDAAGHFVIRKFNRLDADNYLQIDNIDENTVGSRYIVMKVAGWNFVDNNSPPDPEAEEIWLGFLNNDTGTQGSEVTAQIAIERNATTRAIELNGSAVGAGSSDTSRVALANTQSQDFTVVLELNETSDTYEIFYKDGTSPSQFLGAGLIAPGRNGNSVRFTVNDNLGTTLDEYFSIDRIAVSDTNPLTDLLTLEVDRTSGAITLKNTSGAALSGLRSYTMSSTIGALNAANWKSITDFYDQAPGDGSVDPDGAWSETFSTTFNLSEEVVGGNGGNLSNNQQVVLSMGGGAWIKNPVEDVEIVLNFDGGITRKANVNFVGNGGKRFESGDLNFDGMLTTADWTIFIAGAETNLAGLSAAQAYQAGDLNNDGENNIFDFAVFEKAYEAANGAGSFAAMLASIPEPTSAILLALGSFFAVSRGTSPRATHSSRKLTMEKTAIADRPKSFPGFATVLLLLCVSTVASSLSKAAILEEFTFDDPNGTLLANAANSATPGNQWGEDTADMMGSAVFNGNYRIQKNNEAFGTNFLDIENITSGKAWLVAEISGWNLTPTLGAGEDPEEVRFSFLNRDGNDQGGSDNIGQAQFQRNEANGFELVGRLLTSSVDTPILPLTLTRTDPFTVVVEIDEDTSNYSIYYKDNTEPFKQLGNAVQYSQSRDGNALRFVANNHFGGAGEYFDVDRIYLTDVNPTNVVTDRLTLKVNPLTGQLSLMNDTPTTFDIDSYRITSEMMALNFAGWESLSSRATAVDPVDGPDADSILGNGIGETWDEAGGASDSVLAESFLLGSSIFANGREESLGAGFKIGGDTSTLLFQYRNADSGSILTGNIVIDSTGPSGDFDNDGDVDGKDFLLWQRGGSPTPYSQADLTAWKTQYGAGAVATTSAIPEPSSLLLSCLAGLLLTRRRR